MDAAYKQLSIGRIASTGEEIIYNKKVVPDAQFPILSTIVKNCIFYNQTPALATITLSFTPANTADSTSNKRPLSLRIPLAAYAALILDEEITLARYNKGSLLAPDHRGDLLSVQISGTLNAGSLVRFVLHGIERTL